MQWNRRFADVCLLLLACASAATLNAALFTVTNTNDSGPGSLRQAMLDANAQPGSHMIDATGISGTLLLASPLPVVEQDVTIRGPGAAQLILDQSQPAWPSSGAPVLVVHTGGRLQLRDVRIGGSSVRSWQALMVNVGASAEMQDCEVHWTRGITLDGDLTLRRSEFRNNLALIRCRTAATWPVLRCEACIFAENSGVPGPSIYRGPGVLHLLYGSATFEDCEFLYNTGTLTSGGGAIHSKGKLTIRDSLFQGNSAVGSGLHAPGGAISLESSQLDAMALIERTTFRINTSNRDGGAVYIGAGASATIRHCCFTQNFATHFYGAGGAIMAGGEVYLYNCTFFNNAVTGQSGRGGALYLQSFDGELSHCTIVGNSAAYDYGGAYLSAGLGSFRNNVIAGNTAGGVEPDIFAHSAVSSFGGNFVGVATNTSWMAPGDQAGTVANPLQPMLSPLQDNGGPTFTMTPLPGSPLIDAGMPATGSAQQLVQDARGFSRHVELASVPNAAGGDGSDIGAVEFRPPWTLAPQNTEIALVTTQVGTPSSALLIDLTGINVTSPISLVAGTPFEISLNAATGFGPSVMTTAPNAQGAIPLTAIYVRYNPVAGTGHSATLTVSSADATETLTLQGSVVAPGTIHVSRAGMVFESMHSVASPEQSYTVSGSGLTVPVTVSVAAPFEVSLTPGSGFGPSVATAAPVGGEVPPTTIYVRFVPTTTPTAFMTQALHESGNVATTVVELFGYRVPGMVSFVPNTLYTSGMNFTQVMGGAAAPSQVYTLSGTNLTQPISLAASGPFEISFQPASGFGTTLITAPPVNLAVGSVNVYVRYAPTAAGTHTGAITHTSLGMYSVAIQLSGTAHPPGSISVTSASLTFEVPGHGMPSPLQSYSVSGTSMTGPITITAPPSFEVSLSAVGGFGPSVVTAAPNQVFAIPPTPVFVRYNPTSGMTHGGSMDHSAPLVASVFVSVSGDVKVPQIQTSVPNLDFISPGAGSPAPVRSYEVSGIDMVAPVVVSAVVPFRVSLSATAGFGQSVTTPAPVGGVLAPVSIYVQYHPLGGSGDSSVIVHDSTAAPSVQLNVSGVVLPPRVISPGTSSLTFSTFGIGQSAEQHYMLSGSGLSGPITVTAPPPFEVSLTTGGPFTQAVTTAAPVGGDIPATPILVRYLPTSGVSHGGALVHTSTGAPSVSVIVLGAVLPPAVHVSVTDLSFGAVQIHQQAGPLDFDVFGSNLVDPVTIAAPPPYEVSLSASGGYGPTLALTPLSGNLQLTKVYVRYAPTADGVHASRLEIRSTGAPAADINLTGSAFRPPHEKEKPEPKEEEPAGCRAGPGSGGLWVLLISLLVAMRCVRRRPAAPCLRVRF